MELDATAGELEPLLEISLILVKEKALKRQIGLLTPIADLPLPISAEGCKVISRLIAFQGHKTEAIRTP